ncbi:L-type lectin-domain containing receptor kinase VIII.2-like [Gastrolobium bilobum]|uniref:L-type lectin-domain containing receptor kinase VIII.2-like n=1 Tax=Gastrolobium bilobum TaxID=150636 RepID=UPI002AAF45F4|nr:L-type lectin-domain containing receptor kinase VIII.2-like [Gastrolobium bilobum]
MVALSLFIYCSLILLLVQPSSTKSLPNFDPDIDLFGDAHVVVSDGGSHVKLTRPTPSSSGLLLRQKPVTFADPTSLSAEFSFSVSPDGGDGLVLVLVPGDFAASFPGNGSFGLSSRNKYLAIEFDTSKDDNVGDLNANHVGIDVGSLVSVAVANVSAVNLVLNSGKKMNAWVDYEASSKTLEVRLSKMGEPRPSNPIISHSVDLFKIWGGEPVFVGVSSSNDDKSVQVVSVYSWKLALRNVSKSLHSQPAEPLGYDAKKNGKFRPLKVLARVIFGTGCVTLVTFVVLFMWVIFFQKHEEESLPKIPDHPADIRYERIDVAVDKNTGIDEN